MEQAVLEQPPIESITRRIVEAFHPRRVVMFGSRARGDARPDSDVDLMVEMETDLSPPRRAMAIDALFGLRGWAMDVLVYTPAEVRQHRQYRNSLLRVIEAEGKVLYERPG
jgi:predicted nucleotidyltransferase